MVNHQLTFDSPQYLLLLLLLPVLWWLSFRSLAGLGKVRRIVALTLRSLVFAGFVVALAEIQLLKTSEKLTVIYLLDQSQSIPARQRRDMLEYVVREVSKHRNDDREDRAGVIIFGREALIEVPPFDDDIHSTGAIESSLELRSDATNLAAALKLAQASFPEDSAKRIVLVTDGNENLGDARAEGRKLADSGIGIDVVPVKLSNRAEVAVEKVALPPDVRRGQPFDATVVVNNFSTAGDDRAGNVKGKLTVVREIGKTAELLSEQEVELAPGKNVYRFEQKLDQPAVYTYRAKFVPNDVQDDAMVENNEATAFSHIRGKGRVLMIVDWQNPHDFDYLIERLRKMNLEIEIQTTDRLFTSLAELQGYDTVVLADVARSSGSDDGNAVVGFSDEQVRMLVRNTEQMGCGLVMLGGLQSFGAGGWSNSDLEKAMPVDFQIKNTKIQAVGALVMMMHASEMAEGNHWQKVVAEKSIEMMGPLDYAGCIKWDDFGGKESWLWGGTQGLVRIGGQQKQMLAAISKMTPGDMPQFEPSMQMALRAFNRVNASVKHMILISDGDPSPPTPQLLQACKKANVQVSTVAIGTHGPAGSTPLQHIAQVTGGKYYVVTDPKALPKIYQREVRRIARPLVKDLENVRPNLVYRHEMLQGIEGQLPPLKGFVMTTVKENPLVEVSILSPDPAESENATVLASWTYGLGRAAVFTTDTGKRWSSAWTEWSDYDKFFSQMIRWSMRPLGDQGNFSVATNNKDGKVQVIVTALDKDNEFQNFLNLSSAVINPDLTSGDVKFAQVAPGRYVAEFEASKAGSYFVTISPGGNNAPILAGVNVPYSAEFRDRETNLGLLTTLAQFRPKNGQAGELIEGELSREKIEQLLKTDTFRHTLAKAVSSQNVWPLFMVVAAVVFFADVFVRRVTISFDWVAPTWAWVRTNVLGHTAAAPVDARMERLRSRKAAIDEQIDDRRAAARFDPQIETATGEAEKTLDQVLQDVQGATTDEKPKPSTPTSQLTPSEAEEDTYTARLLKAKQKARRENK